MKLIAKMWKQQKKVYTKKKEQEHGDQLGDEQLGDERTLVAD